MNNPIGFGAKVPMMAVSGILSLLLWVVVQITQPANVRYQQVNVQEFNAEDLSGKFVVGKLGRAWIQIEGPEDILTGAVDDVLNKGAVAVYVDLANAHAGVDDYPLRLAFAPQRRDAGYTVSLSQSTLSVTIERADSREMPITIEDTGQIPPEKNLVEDNVTATPSMVKIDGGSSAVRDVKRVRCLLDLSQVDSSGYFPATTEALDDHDHQVEGVTVTPQIVKLSVAVAPAAQSQTVIVVPVWKEHPALGFEVTDYSVQPSQIAVQGPPEDLAKLRTVSTRPISLADLRASATFEEPLELPPHVKSYSVRTVRVHVTVVPGGPGATTAPAATSP